MQPTSGVDEHAARTRGATESDKLPEPVSNAPAGPRPEDPATDDILRRLRSVEGHVRGVGRMVEEDVYCMDVLNQVLAVQRALKKVSGLLLDRHLHHCVTRAIRGEDAEERERVIEEILEAFHASSRG